MYQLIAKAGLTKGASWTLNDRPIVIGRDHTCDVVIIDPLVSRKHCELLAADDGLHLKDLGSSNATLVNGSPVTECLLGVGDELSLGQVVFIVARTEPRESRQLGSNDSSSTVKLSEVDARYFSSSDRFQALRHVPGTIADLANLLHVNREFAQCETVDALLQRITDAVEEHFRPLRFWVITYHGTRPVARYNTSKSLEERNMTNAPNYILDIVSDAQQSILIPRKVTRDSRISIETTLVAPISWHSDRLGAIVVQGETPDRIYDEDDLEFLAALAAGAAPFFHAIEKREELHREYENLKSAAQGLHPLAGESIEIHRIRTLIAKVAPSRQPVLIQGETGTGKELVAQLIHKTSNRSERPFVVVNCAAIPRELFESEFFGHERGAFTGAVSRKIGYIEQSHLGTLFLDEVGDLSLDNQARILRVIESGRFRPLGSQHERISDFRLIAATNHDLSAAVHQGAFRRDLYHRLRGLEIVVPPLRDRRADIAILAEHFLREASVWAQRSVYGFTPEALQYLASCKWPGNVRELKHAICAAAALAQRNILDTEDFQSLRADDDAVKRPETLETIERRQIEIALAHCAGNVANAAKVLGVGRSTLYEKIEKYGLK